MMYYDYNRKREDWEHDFEEVTSADQHQVAGRWEERARKLGLTLPSSEDRRLVDYAWEVRCLVVERHRELSSEESKGNRRAAWEQHLSNDGDRVLFELDELLDAAEEAYQDGLRGRIIAPRRSEAVERYMAIINGVLVARVIAGSLSQETEAELAEVQDTIWRALSEDEQAELDEPNGLIEQAKARWSP